MFNRTWRRAMRKRSGFVSLNGDRADKVVRAVRAAAEALERRVMLSVFQPQDPGFEVPNVGAGTPGSYMYEPAGSPWTFTGGLRRHRQHRDQRRQQRVHRDERQCA